MISSFSLPQSIFDELERFNAIYAPTESIIIHNYSNNNKVKDIIQYADLDTKSIHIIDENEQDNENSVQANNCDNQFHVALLYPINHGF